MPRQRKTYPKTKTTSLEQLPNDVREVFICTADELKCSPTDIWGNCRDREIVDARHICITLVWEYFGSNSAKKGFTLKNLGVFFNRHHSTIIHALEKSENLRLKDDAYSDKYNRVQRMVRTLQKRPDISKIIEMVELLNKENAIKVEEFISDMLMIQSNVGSFNLSTILSNQHVHA